jgi:hypothetical protein
MSNLDNEQTPGEAAAQALSGLGHTLRKHLDRVGFEADKMLRTNRVKAETQRLSRQGSKLMGEISEKVLELEAEGAELEPSLQALVDQVRDIRKKLADKAKEVETINSEAWIEPPPPEGTMLTGQTPQKALPTGERPEVKYVEQEEKPSTVTNPCPSCGGPLRPYSVFCPNCGYKL